MIITLHQLHWGKTRHLGWGLVSIGSEAYHVVSGFGSARGELNHTERSHYFLKHLFLTVFHHIYSMAEYITSNTGGYRHL